MYQKYMFYQILISTMAIFDPSRPFVVLYFLHIALQ